MADQLVPVPPDSTIACVDIWMLCQLPVYKMRAYKALETERRVRVRQVIYFEMTGFVIVDYLAYIPHDWIRTELGQKAKDLLAQAETHQLQLDIIEGRQTS